MANVGIEQKDVFEAANSLVLLGLEPTIKAIREKLGNTGSLTTISKYREEWLKWKEAQSPVAAIPESFTVAANNLWSAAFREAEKIFQSQKEAVSLEKQKWEEERKVYNLELEKLEMDNLTKAKRVEEVESLYQQESKSKNELFESINKLSEQNAKLKGEIEALKERLSSEADRNQRLEKQLIDLIKNAK